MCWGRGSSRKISESGNRIRKHKEHLIGISMNKNAQDKGHMGLGVGVILTASTSRGLLGDSELAQKKLSSRWHNDLLKMVQASMRESKRIQCNLRAFIQDLQKS